MITVKYPVDALKVSRLMYVLTRVCIISDYMRWNEIEWDGMRSNEIKCDEIEWSTLKWLGKCGLLDTFLKSTLVLGTR